MGIEIPQALKAEHEALHEILHRATEEGGDLGAAAKTVAELLHPHFVAEEEYALPPLGLLADLATGRVTPDMQAVLPLTDRLRDDLAQMLDEHKAIVAALDDLAAAAKKAGRDEYVEFADELILHAETEEQVTYPAAILVGEYVRERLKTDAP